MVGMLYTVGMVGMVCIIITHEGGVSQLYNGLFESNLKNKFNEMLITYRTL